MRMVVKMVDKENFKKLRLEFQELDVDGNGFIDADELKLTDLIKGEFDFNESAQIRKAKDMPFNCQFVELLTIHNYLMFVQDTSSG